MSRQYFWNSRASRGTKHGVYDITVMGNCRFEVYIRGEYFRTFATRESAEKAFNSEKAAV